MTGISGGISSGITSGINSGINSGGPCDSITATSHPWDHYRHCSIDRYGLPKGDHYGGGGGGGGGVCTVQTVTDKFHSTIKGSQKINTILRGGTIMDYIITT